MEVNIIQRKVKYDKIRTEVLETYKIRIIRFTNEQIRKNFI